MTVHANSVSAYHSLSLSPREEAVLKSFVESSHPMTDRECMRRMGFTDGNAVKPRITALVQAGLLEETGNTIDKETHKTVRICRPAGRALTIKPVDPQKELRRILCAQIAKLGDQGCTSVDLARTFPSLKPADIDLALGVCWAHGAIERRPFVKRENLPVHFITENGRALLAKTAAP